ncbi:MAG: hypothetical protein GX591_08045 [Planctomycetes bacterium]|nr:hypothetical protein [Planctomycetota bacterium]
MTLQRCICCHTPVPRYYLTIVGLCDDCKWTTWIPRGYARRERYSLDPFSGHPNATHRPPLGAEFLDRRRRRVSDRAPLCGRMPTRRSTRKLGVSTTR